MYPLEAGQPDRGFLVEQFPVVRRSFAQRRVGRLPIGSAGYVVPPGSPDNAFEEITAVRAELGAGVADRGVISGLAELNALLTDVSGVLHFACHNTFTATGSVITLGGGPWKPDDLARAVASQALAHAHPLVFLNACRTAGETQWLGAPTGWASNFMAAGAGAFIGSLWAVRSSSALSFAEHFYEEFVTHQQPLGTASLRARQALADDHGDPTWLAYTVYGNPAATAVRLEQQP